MPYTGLQMHRQSIDDSTLSLSVHHFDLFVCICFLQGDGVCVKLGNDVDYYPGGWVDVYCEQENAYLCQTVTGRYSMVCTALFWATNWMNFIPFIMKIYEIYLSILKWKDVHIFVESHKKVIVCTRQTVPGHGYSCLVEKRRNPF